MRTWVQPGRGTPTRIGNIFSDALDAGLNVGDAIVRAVPGGDWLATAAKNGAAWVGEAAKTPEGLFALQVITSGLATSLSQVALPSVSGMQTVGPVLASVVFALPGTVAGKPFLRSYVEELSTRIVQTAAVLAAQPELAAGVGASLGATLSPAGGVVLSQLEWTKKFQKAFGDQLLKILNNPGFQAAMRQVGDALGAAPTRANVRKTLRSKGLTAPQLGAAYGVRPDVAAAAVNGSLGLPAGIGYGVGAPQVGASEFDLHGRPNDTYNHTETNTGGNPQGTLDPIPGTPLPGPGSPPVPVPTGGGGHVANPPGTIIVRASSPKGVLAQVATAVILTAPLWGTIAYTRWKERR